VNLHKQAPNARCMTENTDIRLSRLPAFWQRRPPVSIRFTKMFMQYLLKSA
jgi:hypothetical protein